MEDLDFVSELRKSVRTVCDPPRWFRGSLLKAFGIGLRYWQQHKTAGAWKLIVLTPRMLLTPTDETNDFGKKQFQDGMRRYWQGDQEICYKKLLIMVFRWVHDDSKHENWMFRENRYKTKHLGR